MELYLGTLVLDLFWMVLFLDIDNYVTSNTNDSYHSLMTTSRNMCDNVIIWHARLGNIRQGRMNRLTRENLLGQFTKIDMPTCEYCLVELEPKHYCNWFVLKSMILWVLKQGMGPCSSLHL